MAEILIYDEIEGGSARSLRDQLDSIEVSSEPLTVRVNSVGGSVFDGLAMYAALKQYPGKVTTIVEGLAGSIASIIALAADDVVMAEGSFFMIHNPWTQTQGNADELRKSASDLEKMQGQLLAIYRRETGRSDEELQALMDAETYLDASESLKLGFAGRVEGNADFSMAAVARLTNIPTAIEAKLTGKATAMTEEEKAKMKALEEECEKLKAELEEGKSSDDEEEAKSSDEEEAKAEGDDEEEAKASDDDEEEGDEEEAKASLVAAVKSLTGAKSFAEAEGKFVALHAKSGKVALNARAAKVEGLIKAGKITPHQKEWALTASAKALKSYEKSLGGSTVVPLDSFTPAAKVEAPSGEDAAAAKIRASMGGKK